MMILRISITSASFADTPSRLAPDPWGFHVPRFLLFALAIWQKRGSFAVVCQIACRSHGMVNLQVNSVQ